MTDDATAAYLQDEAAQPVAFKSGHRIDAAKAIAMHPQANPFGPSATC